MKQRFLSRIVLLVFFLTFSTSSIAFSQTTVLQNNKIVVGYFPAWGIYYDYFVKDIDPSKITHINYAFINVKNNRPVIGVTERNVGDAWADYQRSISAPESVDGTADTWDQPLKGNWNQLRKLKSRNPHLKVLAALGGWTWSEGFSDAALPENREAFVAACIDTLILGNLPYDAASNTGGTGSAAGVFDGIDIDWEYPVCCGSGSNYRPEDKQNYTALLAEFRKQLNNIDPGLLLTIAAPAGPHNIINHELSQFPQYLNFINLMAYDYHGSWDAHTGHLAPMYAASDDPFAQPGFSMDETVQTYHVQYGIPKEKLVLGLPFYGRSWTGVPSGPNGDGLYQSATGAGPGERDEPGMLNYSTIISCYAPVYTKYYHNEARVPWLYDGSNFITYDGPSTISDKAQYIRQQGLGGAMFWNLMSDVKGNPAPANSLLSALWDGLGGIIPTYQCSDGIDNDGDGLVDLQDPDCINAQDDDESTPPVCGKVEAETVIRDDWGDGYCADVTVTNNTCESVVWQVSVTVDGTIDNLWNGEYTQGDGAIQVKGAGWNSELAAGRSTSFGFCAKRDQKPPTYQCNDGIDNDGDGLVDLNDPGCADAEDNDETNGSSADVVAEVKITDDWNTGYCSDVTIKNSSTKDIDWKVTLEIKGNLRSLWGAFYVKDGDQLTLEGKDWNNIVPAGSRLSSIGFCVDR